MAAGSPVRCGSIRRSIARPTSATSRCCWRASRRPSSRATASRARRRRWRPAPASSSWTTASRIRRWPRISPSWWSMRGAASATAGCIPAGPLRAPLGAQLDRAQALIVVGDGRRAPSIAGEARKRACCRCSARGSRPMPAFIAALARRPRARLRRHRRSGEILCDAARCRRRGRGDQELRRSPSLHAAPTRRRCATTPTATGLVLVTTEKDLARMQGDEDAAATCRARARAAGDAGVR